MYRRTQITLLFLGAATCVPSLTWAASDCGNPTVKTAEIVHMIRTPEQLVPTRVDPVERPLEFTETQTPESNPQIIDPIPNVIETIQTAEVATQSVNSPAGAYAAVLERRITRGKAGLNLFDYKGALAAGELATIRAYTDHLAAQNPDEMSENDQIAYWANLYNALTVKLILENYPVKSIREVKAGALSRGPWKRDEVTVNGKILSLNDIEHEILRKRYPNPALVHYMVNCASIGCPNLQPKLWSGATLDKDRDAAAREFVNSPRGVQINKNGLKASSIFNWFKSDFGGSKSTTLAHFRKYAGPELLEALDSGAKIEGYGYDWTLNE